MANIKVGNNSDVMSDGPLSEDIELKILIWEKHSTMCKDI